MRISDCNIFPLGDQSLRIYRKCNKTLEFGTPCITLKGGLARRNSERRQFVSSFSSVRESTLACKWNTSLNDLGLARLNYNVCK
jgi:hypothetical protein